MFNARLGTAIALLLTAVGCASLFSNSPESGGPTSAPPTVMPGFSTTAPPTVAPFSDSPAAEGTVPTTADTDVQISIETENSRPLSSALRGTNVAAWVGGETISDSTFLERARVAGVTVLRLPGGSWSNYYDWLACERDGLGIDDAAECFWPWAAKPSDFLPLIANFEGDVIYTVNANGTAQEAAALVAFFNGQTGDDTAIGPDIRGRDWGTAGQWAQLRAERGFPAPVDILYWEVGNEFYGGTADSGTDCSSFGWEDVWTCDGREYVRGITGRDGFLAFAEAIKAVDPDVKVGAIGVAPQREWSNWGNEVLSEAGDEIDFYIIHQYGFFETPRTLQEILAQPAGTWPAIMEDYRLAVDELAGGRDIPVAVTEFNLFAFQENDTAQLMRRAINAFFLADTLGQMGWSGVEMATQWNLANGRAENGTDYGLIDSETLEPLPAYYVYPLWRDFGDEMLLVEESLGEPALLSAYAGRANSGQIALMVLNKTQQPLTVEISIDGQSPQPTGSVHTLIASSLDAQTVTFNGQEQPVTLPNPPTISWAQPGVLTVPALSISRFTLTER